MNWWYHWKYIMTRTAMSWHYYCWALGSAGSGTYDPTLRWQMLNLNHIPCGFSVWMTQRALLDNFDIGYWWQELNNCASKDCLWRTAWSDGLQHCGLSRYGARRQSINQSLVIVFILFSGSATMLTEFGLCYPSYDHPETAGSIECNFVLGKADEHFQSW